MLGGDFINSTKKLNQYSVLNEIKYLRDNKDTIVEHSNSNRYRVIVKEEFGNSAYCFSTPIYSSKTRKLIKIEHNDVTSDFSFSGSNGTIIAHHNSYVFENCDGKAIVTINGTFHDQETTKGSPSSMVVVPTFNGLRFIVKSNFLSFGLKADVKAEGVRYNPSCISIMKETFKPFLSVSSLYASDCKGSFSPVEMRYMQNGTDNYEIELFHDITDGTFHFEINLYEPKLLQDTTVESAHPDTNNVYGSIGFIGKTKQFGQQWLYTRPDFSKVPDLASYHINKVLLHIPVLNGSLDNVDAYIPKKRFCSFGSTWNDKVDVSDKVVSSNNNGRYLTIDVTALFTDPLARELVYNEGLLLRKTKGLDDFIVLSTSDCYSAPQIIEINFQ